MSCLSKARGVLNAFHEEEKIAEAQQRRLPDAVATIPKRPRARGAGRVNRDLLQRLGERCAIRRSSRWIKMHIIESRKREPVYVRRIARYQPMLAVWGRDGCGAGRRISRRNVRPQMAPLTVAQAPSRRHLKTVTSYYYRATPPATEEVVRWLLDEKTRRRPADHCFAVSARMSEGARGDSGSAGVGMESLR